MTIFRSKLASLEQRFGYWTSRALILFIVVALAVLGTRLGRLLHDLLCAEHGVWPTL